MGGSIALAAALVFAAGLIRDLQAGKAERYVGDVVRERAAKSARRSQQRPGNGAAVPTKGGRP